MKRRYQLGWAGLRSNASLIEGNALVPVAGETVSSPEIGEDVAVMRIEGKCALVRRDAEGRFAPQPMGDPDGLERQWIVRRQGDSAALSAGRPARSARWASG